MILMFALNYQPHVFFHLPLFFFPRTIIESFSVKLSNSKNTTKLYYWPDIQILSIDWSYYKKIHWYSKLRKIGHIYCEVIVAFHKQMLSFDELNFVSESVPYYYHFWNMNYITVGIHQRIIREKNTKSICSINVQHKCNIIWEDESCFIQEIKHYTLKYYTTLCMDYWHLNPGYILSE